MKRPSLKRIAERVVQAGSVVLDMVVLDELLDP